MIYIHSCLRAFSFCFTSQQCCLCSQSSGQRELTLSGPRTEIPPPHPSCTPLLIFLLFSSFPTFSYNFPTREIVLLCVRVTKCACVSACAYTLNAWHGARCRQIASWRKHYSVAYSIQITQMFIATSATTGGEGWTFGRLAGFCSSWSCGFWCHVTASQEELTHSSMSHIKTVLSAAEKGLKVQHKHAEMHALILLMCNLQTTAIMACFATSLYLCLTQHLVKQIAR